MLEITQMGIRDMDEPEEGSGVRTRGSTKFDHSRIILSEFSFSHNIHMKRKVVITT